MSTVRVPRSSSIGDDFLVFWPATIRPLMTTSLKRRKERVRNSCSELHIVTRVEPRLYRCHFWTDRKGYRKRRGVGCFFDVRSSKIPSFQAHLFVHHNIPCQSRQNQHPKTFKNWTNIWASKKSLPFLNLPANNGGRTVVLQDRFLQPTQSSTVYTKAYWSMENQLKKSSMKSLAMVLCPWLIVSSKSSVKLTLRVIAFSWRLSTFTLSSPCCFDNWQSFLS